MVAFTEITTTAFLAVFMDAQTRGQSAAGVVILGGAWLHTTGDPALRRSTKITMLGTLYAMALLGGWIALAATRGV